MCQVARRSGDSARRAGVQTVIARRVRKTMSSEYWSGAATTHGILDPWAPWLLGRRRETYE